MVKIITIMILVITVRVNSKVIRTRCNNWYAAIDTVSQTTENKDYLKFTKMKTSKECHITYIRFIWLDAVKFILPKRPFSPNIVYTICLVNERYFLISHTMMFVILKVSMKWNLFDGTPWWNPYELTCNCWIYNHSQNMWD